MSDSYLVHLPDGTEYGPVDRATLAAWHSEGRLPADALVWPHGAPEWLSVEAVLAAEAGPAAAVPPAAAPVESSRAATASAAKTPSPTRAMREKAATPHAATPQAAAPRAATPAGPAGAAKAPAAGPTAPKPKAAPAQAGPAAPSHAATVPVTTGAAPHPAPAAPEGGAPPGDRSTDTRPRGRSPFPQRPRATAAPALDPAALRRLVYVSASLAVLLAILFGLFTLLRPLVARRWAVAAVKEHALPERHIEDGETGLVADLPAGWFALRADNPFVSTAGARLYLAQPSVGAFGTVVVEARPLYVDDVDAYLDELLQQRAARRPGTREEARSQVQLGRGQGRLVRTVWQDGAKPMVAATIGWVDGYEMLTLETWAPAEAGAEFSTEVDALCRGLRATGELETRVSQAVDRLALEVPELSPDVLRLLVAERMSRGEGLEGVPAAALLMVSRGLDVLTPAEAEEMRVIYQQVWEPVPETDRERMAALLRRIRSGREVPAADMQLLREVLKAGMLALEPAQRSRLQQLSGRAARRALGGP